MDQKLLLKEKDYELLASKRKIEPKHSFNDPLINPPKRKKTNKSKNVSRDISPLLSNNILMKSTTPKLLKVANVPDDQIAH